MIKKFDCDKKMLQDEDVEDDDMEYQDSGDSSDDEETILEQEKTEGTVDYKQEIDDLKVIFFNFILF